MKTTRIIGLLLALGISAFISNASAELPKPGEYKGTLTITKTMNDQEIKDAGPPIILKTVFKATARVDAQGFFRIVYSGDHPSIFGQFESDKLLTGNFTFEGVVLGARTIEFSTFMAQNLFGPNNTQVAAVTDIVTKLKWVTK